MTQSLPLHFSQRRQEKLFYEKLELLQTTDQGDNQFVFQGQCMVLGNSGVGKTSLVKSLTGESFNPKQAKTQGIDECLVDEKWKSLNIKELIFGDLWRFFSFGHLQVLLIGTGETTSNVIVEDFLLWKRGFQFSLLLWAIMAILLLILMAYNDYLPVGLFLFQLTSSLPEIAPFCAFHFARNKLRFSLATFSFILRRRGYLIGVYLVLVICYWDVTCVEGASIRAILLSTLLAGIQLMALFVLIGPISIPFVNDQHCYTVRLIRNRLTMVHLCLCRLLLSINIGLISGFVAASLVSISFKPLKDFVMQYTSNWETVIRPFGEGEIHFCVYPFVWQFPVVWFEPRMFSTIFDGSWGPYALIIVLIFYHCKLAWYSCNFYFAIIFPLFVCYTFYVELFCFHLTVPGNSECPNKLITLVTGNAEMNQKMLKGALDAKFSSIKLKILDFAGDKDYYAYHHIFLRSDAINIIVFNMAEFAGNNLRDITTKVQRLQFWFESVSSHVPRKSPIFLVGTHRGTMDKNSMKILNGHLRQSLWNLHCDELVVNKDEDLIFFPVENSCGHNDIGVQCLRKEIISNAEQCKKTIGREVPLTWVRVQDAIISLQEKKQAKFCVTFAEFPRAFDDFVCNSCSKDTLKYFHEKGLVIYLDKNQDVDLSNWVLLKPEILVDIIIQLVTPPPGSTQQRGLRHDWNLLQKKGMLTKSLLRSIISKVKENEEAMTAFLEEYDLICPLINKKVEMCNPHEENEEQPTHFVPSLLPMSSDGVKLVWDVDVTDKKFYLFFARFLPEPLFHRLLSRAHKNSKVEFLNGQTVLYKDAGKFWMSPWQPYMLKLLKEKKMIEVTFSCR